MEETTARWLVKGYAYLFFVLAVVYLVNTIIYAPRLGVFVYTLHLGVLGLLMVWFCLFLWRSMLKYEHFALSGVYLLIAGLYSLAMLSIVIPSVRVMAYSLSIPQKSLAMLYLGAVDLSFMQFLFTESMISVGISRWYAFLIWFIPAAMVFLFGAYLFLRNASIRAISMVVTEGWSHEELVKKRADMVVKSYSILFFISAVLTPVIFFVPFAMLLMGAGMSGEGGWFVLFLLCIGIAAIVVNVIAGMMLRSRPDWAPYFVTGWLGVLLLLSLSLLMLPFIDAFFLEMMEGSLVIILLFSFVWGVGIYLFGFNKDVKALFAKPAAPVAAKSPEVKS